MTKFSSPLQISSVVRSRIKKKNYISAVSKKLMPATKKPSSRRRKDCDRVFCSPNVIVPIKEDRGRNGKYKRRLTKKR